MRCALKPAVVGETPKLMLVAESLGGFVIVADIGVDATTVPARTLSAPNAAPSWANGRARTLTVQDALPARFVGNAVAHVPPARSKTALSPRSMAVIVADAAPVLITVAVSSVEAPVGSRSKASAAGVTLNVCAERAVDVSASKLIANFLRAFE